MHIRFNDSIAGHNFSYAPGDVADWPDEVEARRLVDRGIADELTADAAIKVAASSGRNVRRHRVPETAVQQRQTEKAVAR